MGSEGAECRRPGGRAVTLRGWGVLLSIVASRTFVLWRSRKHEPKKAGAARTRWLDEGWVEYGMRLKEDTEARELREISQERRLSYVKGLAVGGVIGVSAG